MKTVRQEKMLINNEWVNASDGGTLNNYNPYNGELIGTVPAATKEDVDRAVACAKKGFETWSKMRCDERDAVLEKFLTLVDENSEELAQELCEESGKAISECRGEVGLVRKIFRAYMNAANTLYGQSLPHDTETRNIGDVAFTEYEPLGVCVCIAPFNYPISTMTNKVAPALCAGNSVIMKPASDTPMSILYYAKLMQEAGMPANVVQVITGSGSKVGSWVTANPDVALVSLTGSTEVGVTLHRSCSEQLKKCLLELGGNDPLIIYADCDIDKAVDEAIAGRVFNCGQVCSGSKRFLVEKPIYKEFTEKLVERLKTIKYGDPTDSSVVMGTLINKKAADKIMDQIKMTVDAGAKLVYGGERKADTFITPAVLTGVNRDMEIAKDMEVFGPVFPIIEFEGLDEAISIANQTTYGLSSGVITNDFKKAMKTAYAIQAGTCVIGGTGDYRTSYHGFGGYKMSGIGREGAISTVKEFSEIKTIAMKGILN